MRSSTGAININRVKQKWDEDCIEQDWDGVRFKLQVDNLHNARRIPRLLFRVAY